MARRSLLEEELAAVAARPDVREAVACRLYEKGVFSLGRAAEWTGLSIDEMKESLHRQGIRRESSETSEEIEAAARRTARAAGRASA